MFEHLRDLGGTNPYPLAPMTTPLVSPLSGGAWGNSTGPLFCLGSLVLRKGVSRPPEKALLLRKSKP